MTTHALASLLALSTHLNGVVMEASRHTPMQGVSITVKGTHESTVTDKKGHFNLYVHEKEGTLVASYLGFASRQLTFTKNTSFRIFLTAAGIVMQEDKVVASGRLNEVAVLMKPAGVAYADRASQLVYNTESYNTIHENFFRDPLRTPLSTFSIDVDAASYSNVRRYIQGGSLPPIDAVRVEEMINYFTYTYPDPVRNEPVCLTTETGSAPWEPSHVLVKIGMKARTIATKNLPSSNLVFLVDVSGSMFEPNKLPLVKSALKLLVDQLRSEDHIALVAYAGNVGLVLPSTAGNKKETIRRAIDNLEAGGSTAGGAGIQLAYKVAVENFIKGGNNRVILNTDGDFNVGVSSDAEMGHLIERERETGVYLSVLGYGMGNYKDSKMVELADKGNGNYAYIDGIEEAKKVLVHEFGATLFTVAKDVKLQVEFNPAYVTAYRLIGYEKRLLHDEDFNNDRKDAGDVGSGHTVTALYELIPKGVKNNFPSSVDPLKYAHRKDQTNEKEGKAQNTLNGEMMTITYRYKLPELSKSSRREVVVPYVATKDKQPSIDFLFAAGVAEFGMLLRDSEFKQGASFSQALELTRKGKGQDVQGYRAQCISLIESASLLKGPRISEVEN